MFKLLKRMNYYYSYNLPLFYKLMVSYLAMIVLPMLVFSTVVYSRVDKILEEQLKYSARQNFDQTVMSLENTINRYDNLLFSISRSDLFYKIIKKASNQNYSYSDKIADKSTLERMMYTFVGTLPCSLKVYLNDDADYFANDQTYFNYYQVKDENWFIKLNENFTENAEFRLLFPPSYTSDTQSDSIRMLSIARVITCPDDLRQCIGVLRADFKEKEIQNIIINNNAFSGSVTYILTEDNVTLSSSDDTLSDQYITAGITADSAKVKEGIWNDTVIDDHYYYTMMKPVEPYNINLITVISREGILNKCVNIRNMIILLMLVLCIFTIIFAYWISLLLHKRISLLTSTMRKVQKGCLTTIDKSVGKDEIGELIEDYNYMIGEMKKYAQKEYENGRELKNAEIKVLQAQINPHFLYNTLDMINWFASENMNAEIRIAVQSLAKFYRLSLSNGEDVISIRDELEHVSAYMKLQNMRYLNKLHFVIKVPDDIQNYSILKTTLQPIVENAIVHGIMEKPEKEGTITICAVEEPGSILFTVSDDGVGMSAEKLKEIESHTVHRKHGSGYGTINVDARIKAYYGDLYGLFYRSEEGKGTTVEIRIPVTPLC